MSDRLRTGRKVGRTIYAGDELVGVMDTRELASAIVSAYNAPSLTLPQINWLERLVKESVPCTPVLTALRAMRAELTGGDGTDGD